MRKRTADTDGCLTPCRELRNVSEEAFRQEATSKGWVACKKGWPDFICEKEGKIIVVEIKTHRRRVLKREQLRVLQLLAQYGVPCYRWSPADGFQQIKPDNPL